MKLKIFSTDSSTVSLLLLISNEGATGASNGAVIPVKSLISPRRAFA